MHRLLRILVIVGVTASLSMAADDSPFNVDFFPGWDGYYRPMQWMPVEVGVASDLTQPFSGVLVMSAAQDGLNTLDISHPFVLTPDLPLRVPLVTKMAFAADKCTLKLVDEKGRMQWRQSYDMLNFGSSKGTLTAVSEDDLLIGLVGNSRFGLLQLEKEAACTGMQNAGKVYVATKVPRMLPWDWTGYSCLDLLVLYDPDWSLINEQQRRAICQWVSNGGRLVLVAGGNIITQDNPIGRILPFDLGELREKTLPRSLERKWKLDPDVTEAVKARELTVKTPGSPCYILGDGDEPKLCGIGAVGFGGVLVLGFDPGDFSTAQRADSAAFWSDKMAALLEGRLANPGVGIDYQGTFGRLTRRYSSGKHVVRSIEVAPEKPQDGEPDLQNANNYRRNGFYQIGAGMQATNQVMEFLYDIPQMRPLSIWWVILLLASLAVLLGPVDYLVLKRLDRLPLTWLTSAGWIVLFTVGAYYGVQALRGGRMQLRTVSVCDNVQGSPLSWNTSYVGLFAPFSGSFDIEGFDKDHWWSGVSPTQQSVWMYNQDLGTRVIPCIQQDGSNVPFSLPVSIWTIQCLIGEWSQESVPFDASVRVNGEKISVDVDNHSRYPISGGFVLNSSGEGFKFGRVDAEGKGTFQGKADWGDVLQLLRGYGPSGKGFDRRYRDSAYFKSGMGVYDSVLLAQGCLQRTEAMDVYMRDGAVVVVAEYEGPPVEFGVKDYSYTGVHIYMARQVVFPIKDNEGMGQ